ncbi:MAG: hypothetical protein BRC58_10180 [Cyanobacteria bacterium QS_8_64_29]|nr:MAG: hypothetical protein BRC58_10180 [Cyanobacteria bacterium QS_8_64_29]
MADGLGLPSCGEVRLIGWLEGFAQTMEAARRAACSRFATIAATALAPVWVPARLGSRNWTLKIPYRGWFGSPPFHRSD